MLTNSANASSTTDTIYFDGYTETVLSGGTTTTTKYYSANGSRVAMRVGATLSYLLSDPLGSNSVALNAIGQVSGLQHYSPYGTMDYTWGTMPTSYNYAGQRLDSQTGLLYDDFRYYDPVTGRFVRADTVQNNANGMDPYAYVGDNPETRNDPTGHCFIICAIVGAVVGTVVSVGIQAVTNIVQHKPVTSGLLEAGVSGFVAGGLTGLLGPAAGGALKLVSAFGPVARAVAGIGLHAAIGAVSGGLAGMAARVVSNEVDGRSWNNGLLEAGGTGAFLGGITGGLLKGTGMALNRLAGKALTGLAGAVEIPEGKFRYFFGDVTSSAHNEARSAGMALQFKQLGVPFDDGGRTLVGDALRKAALDPTNVVGTETNQWGTRIIKQSLFAGPSGKFAAFESSWMSTDDGGLRLSTLKIFGVRVKWV